MNLLQLIQQVCQELALPVPNAIMASGDPQTKQMYALLNRMGQDLTKEFQWQFLDREWLIRTVAVTKTSTLVEGLYAVTMASTAGINKNYGVLGDGIPPFAQVLTVDSPTQVTLNMPVTSTGTFSLNFAQVQYPFPDDWQYALPQTQWDRTNRWPLEGPQTPQSWQAFKSGVVYQGPRIRYRLLNNTIALNPPPPNAHVFSMEYISKSFVLAADGVTRKAGFTADDDTCLFDDSLMVTGLKAKFKQAKGLDYIAEAGEYSKLLSQAKSDANSAPRLTMSGRVDSILLGPQNIPDGNWRV